MNTLVISILFVAVRVSEGQSAPKISCRGAAPFKSKDDDCLSFSQVCLKSDLECKSFLDTCKQCPPTNASITMQRDLFNVVKDQSNLLRLILDVKQNQSTDSLGKYLDHIAGNVGALIGIIIFLLILMIIMMVVMLVEVRFKLITKTFESKKGKRFYRNYKTEKYKSYRPISNQNNETSIVSNSPHHISDSNIGEQTLSNDHIGNNVKHLAGSIDKIDLHSRLQNMENRIEEICLALDSGQNSEKNKRTTKFKLDGEEEIIEIAVKSTDNIIKLKRQICEAFSKENCYDCKTMKLEYNGKLLDDNEYLMPRLTSPNVTIDCKIFPSSSSSEMVILKLETFSDDKFPEWIQVNKNESIENLKRIIWKVSDISDVVVFEGNRELKCEEKIGECGLSDEMSIRVIPKQCGRLLINFTFEKKDPIVIDYTNIDPVSRVKDILSNIMKLEVSDFILFSDTSYLEDKKYIFEYGIKNCSQIEYCSLRRERDQKVSDHEFVKEYEFEKISYCMESKGLLNELIKYRTLKNNERFVQLHGLSFVKDTLLVFMEKILGKPLHHLIKPSHPVEINIIRNWSKQILEGLMCLHDKQIMYRDLKMSNILVDANGNIKLSSFGLKKYVQGPDAAAMLKGMYYKNVSGCNFIRLAPEVREKQHFGTYTDVWSFGVILFHLRKGTPIFSDYSDSTELETIYGSISNEVRGLTPVNLRNFVSGCLEVQPENRATVKILLENEFL